MADKLIYLDNNATTKVDEKVLEEMLPYFCENYANPGGMYDFAGKVGAKLKDAREAVKEFMGAKDQKEIAQILLENGGELSENVAGELEKFGCPMKYDEELDLYQASFDNIFNSMNKIQQKIENEKK